MAACTRANLAYTTYCTVPCIHLLCIRRLCRWTCWNWVPPVDHNVCSISELIRHSNTFQGDDGYVVGKESLKFKPRNRLLSQFCAFTCFVFADYAVEIVGIEFFLLTIMLAASANSSGMAIANSVDGNAVRTEVWLGFL